MERDQCRAHGDKAEEVYTSKNACISVLESTSIYLFWKVFSACLSAQCVSINCLHVCPGNAGS